MLMRPSASMTRENRDALEALESHLRLNPAIMQASEPAPSDMEEKMAEAMEAEGKAAEGEAPPKKKKKPPQVQRAKVSFKPGKLPRAHIDKGIGSDFIAEKRGKDMYKVLPLIPPPSERCKSTMARVEASARARKLNIVLRDPHRVGRSPEALKWVGQVYWSQFEEQWFEGRVTHYFTPGA